MSTARWWWVVLVCLVVVPAAAEERPTFALMDQQVGSSRLGLDGSLVFPRDVEAYGIRFDGYGQFVTRSHFGGYLHFGVTHLHNQGLSESDFAPVWWSTWPDRKLNSPTAGTNIEAGAIYILEVPEAKLDVTFRVAGVLAAGPDINDWNSLANLFTFMGRVSDYELVTPGISWLRSGVIVAGHRQRFYYQGDLSASASFVKHDGMSNFGVFHANFGVGAELGPIGVEGELANMAVFGSEDNQWVHAVAVGLSYGTGPVRPRACYMLPFGRGGSFGNVFMLGLTWTVGRQRSVLESAVEED